MASLGWKEANSEPRAPGGKSQYELKEKLLSGKTQGGRRDGMTDYLQVESTNQFARGINPVDAAHTVMEALAQIVVGK